MSRANWASQSWTMRWFSSSPSRRGEGGGWVVGGGLGEGLGEGLGGGGGREGIE